MVKKIKLYSIVIKIAINICSKDKRLITVTLEVININISFNFSLRWGIFFAKIL